MVEFLATVNWEPIFSAIWTVIILPFLIWAKGKIAEWAKIRKIEKYTDMLMDSIEIVVKDIQEEIVKGIKGTDEWTEEKIAEVRQIAINKAIASMTYEGYKILSEANGDFEDWVDSIIRAKLYDLKKDEEYYK
jgi:hypothetical protein